MDLSLKEYNSLIRPLGRTASVSELNLFFNNTISYLKNLVYSNEKHDGLDILTNICDDLACVRAIQLYDHPIIRNHPIFIYIGRTLEVLLMKSNHLRSIPMKKCEENCFYSVSYFIAQLCLYHNEPIQTFYGSFSNESFSVTDKINIRDESINENNRKSNKISDKPNLKITCIPPSAPEARSTNKILFDITDTPKKRLFSNEIISPLIETEEIIESKIPSNLPSKRYQDVFFTTSFLNKFIRSIDDLSRNEYSSYHVKYKVIDRLVRLCSKLNIINELFDSIISCLCSKFYQQIFLTIEPEQIRLSPKQLFFIYQCTQFIIQNQFQQQEQIPNLLCQTMINTTKIIIEYIFPMNDDELNSIYFHQQDIALYALNCHLELLNYLSLTSNGRRYFLQTNIIDLTMNILQQDQLIVNACEHEELFHSDIAVIVHTIMLLYNLAYEKQIFLILKKRDFLNIYFKLKSSNDKSIKFVCKTLSSILNQDQIHEENEPMKLKQAYIKHLEEPTEKSKDKTVPDIVRITRERDDNIKLAILNETYITNLSRDVEELSRNESSISPAKYKSIGQRVRVVTKQETKEVESLLDPILKCLNSSFYLKIFENIELSHGKVISGIIQTNRSLATKHIFFMRECPEFLFRHDYKRRKEIANSLGRKMLEHTKTIFNQHLSILIGEEGKQPVDEMKAARMIALSYHIKVLNHFTLIRSIRKEFLSLSIIEQILKILQDRSLTDRDQIVNEAKTAVVEQSLILLYSLGQEKEIIGILRKKNLFDICLKLRIVKDRIIRFVSQILLTLLDKDAHKHIHEPHSLSKTCIEYIDKAVKETRKSYQGIKLHRLLKNLEIMTVNDTFIECLLEAKQGITVFIKCICIKYFDEKDSDSENKEMISRIHNSAVSIIWRISSYGPKPISKLKANDLFIDQILILSKGKTENTKRAANGIIWRLGNEDKIRFEKSQKKRNQENKTDDDQVIEPEEWDESIPYDLLISYSNKTNDKIISGKIYNRLITKGYRVYSEKSGQNRFELMQKAIDSKKPILVCLSSAYRASTVCMAEVEYASKQSSPIISVIVEAKYDVQGWLKHLIGGKKTIDVTQKKFDEGFINILEEIEKTNSSN
ncbi:unnamed protein product [Rotaria sordida]|uniref:TIR domain-containing protein n=1 Tax=Rotaria sordida TaxID=392033 RepID=A0A815HSK0_9BILA|nr:unnamed protein product [Rotaria sordida]CAF1605223.1 unnamed protein product [Rotaria sordida]